MKKLLIGLVATSSLVFGTGCGGDGDLCEDTADAYNSLADKVEDCPEIAQFIGMLELGDEEIRECKESLDSCSDSDKDKIRSLVDCLNDMPRCRSSNEEAWVAELQACGEESGEVSEACGG
ncbi:hypothetical protein [Myxococcus sp. SDU36]|uniref:hypothetical protein n=1 Tax=Myxococcus sp. SDU36 TaxID=2831967 RepID=UPI0025429B72|nr:hypothetical protein [Myxococcus sp. SDU36]WIG95448.1 hypothetical protein KGD87_33965 [Myxococcus sp. SDU36]